MAGRGEPHFGPGQRPLTDAERAVAAAATPLQQPRKPRSPWPSFWVLLFVVLLPVLLAAAFHKPRDPEADARRKAEQEEIWTIAKAVVQLRHHVKDPDSLKTRYERVAAPGVVCGEFNAKNSFGAYVGYQGFVVEIPGNVVSLQQSFSASKWKRLWADRCG